MKAETLKKAKSLENEIEEYTRLIQSKNASFGYMLIKITCSNANDHEDYYGRMDKEVWLKLLEVVKEEREKKKQELAALSDEQPSAAERVMENMKQLSKAINSMGVKASDLTNTSYDDCRIQTPPNPIGYLELEEAMTRLPVFKRIGWFHRRMLRWFFGIRYIKSNPET